MGSYGQNDDWDEYEDDFIDDQDGGVGPSKYRYAGDEEGDGEEYEEEEEEEEEVEEEPVSQEALKLLKYRQKLKEQLRHKLRQENGSGLSKSLDQGRKPPLNNFGSFFGPSQPVIADRVVQESKALLETRHLAPKASTSQNNGKKVNMASTSGVKNGYNMPSTSGARNGVSRESLTNQGKSKVQTMKHARDYSFLLSDDADVPKPQRDNGQPKNLASRPDARPAQLPTQSNRSSGPPSRKVVNVNEQRKAHGTPQVGSARTAPVRKLTSDNRASVVSSNLRRELDPRKQPQPQSTKQVSTSSGNGSVRPPLARAMPPRKPLSSTDKKMPMQKRPPPAKVNDRVPPVSKHSVPNGQRLPVQKPKGPSVSRPQDRNASVQHSKDNRVFKKDNVTTSQKQMKPPRPSSLQTNLDRDRSRVQKHCGQLRVQSQSGGVRKESNIRKRKFDDDDDDEDDPTDYRTYIRRMFKYNRNKYVNDSDEEDDKGMEVDFATIQREESRSARIAKKEDDEELEKIMEDERQERLRKKAKMRKMSQR